MTYEEALNYVAGLAPRGWRLGLDRMREFAHRVGLDDALGAEGGPQFIHIAGTNGKGSTTAYVQSILHETGYRTGAFFSPYVYDPRERIQLGRELIPEGVFAGLTALLQPIAEEFTETEYGGISEFEFKTAMAFLFFKRLKCEWVAMEVGLGGRLDATNILTPRVSVIVSIGLDHTNVLGDTLGAIAHEKAGIIKAGVPVVVGQVPESAWIVIEEEAARKAAPLWKYGRDITVAQDVRDGSIVVRTPEGEHAGLKLGIRGAMQGHNMALAVAACDACRATRTLGGLQRGTAKATIPGRFEVRQIEGKTVVLDGAHNADAAVVLLESLRTFLETGVAPGSDEAPRAPKGGRVLMVAGMVAGHDPAAFFAALGKVVDKAYAVPIDFHRGLTPQEVAASLKGCVPETVICPRAKEGIQMALREASAEDTVLVTGSFYLVGEIGRFLASQRR